MAIINTLLKVPNNGYYKTVGPSFDCKAGAQFKLSHELKSIHIL